jgi:hypothetical protein
MKQLVYKLCTLVLLSVTYAAALSGNFMVGGETNPIKAASKTNFFCLCEPPSGVVMCHTSCTLCCPK